MLSEDRARQIETEATARADQISDESLMKEAARIRVEHHDAVISDKRTELGIIDRVYTREIVRRGLTAK